MRDTPLNLHGISLGPNQSEISSDDDYVDAVVSFVDVISNTFDAVAIENNRVLRGVQFAKIMPNFSGEVRYPIGGDTVRIRISKSGVPYLADGWRPTDVRDETNGMPKHKFVGHPYLRKSMPGDKHIFGVSGGFLSFLRGGITKIGSSPLCQLIFIKFENMIKMISQQWHFVSCGLHGYSVNDNGSVTTRLSFFRKDRYGVTHEDSWSQSSDYDILIDDNGFQLFSGPVSDGAGTRTNRTLLRIFPNGNIFIGQGEIDKDKYRQTFTMSPSGQYLHEQFDSEMTTCTYHREVVQCDDFTKVDERVVGSVKSTVTGKYSISADEGVYLHGAHLYLDGEISIKETSTYHAIIADVKND